MKSRKRITKPLFRLPAFVYNQKTIISQQDNVFRLPNPSRKGSLKPERKAL
ncbi:hypothetical protein GCWU000324_01520 [Kingella oralis ATCC 51147]|uniref:Uncharacterized protein n=1 Tax=Kingella oralis ATCC 51147 TaxID=629741 RepID=C4GKL7_9NEIS|nr:hypothetical protein GCWU000324_01520 [Kingella oralis ATCC 51147]